MASPIVVRDLLKDILTNIGAVAVGETISPEDGDTALRTLNDFIEALTIDNMAVWISSNQTFNTVSNQATYTIGPGGNWDTDRPIDISAAYYTLAGVDYPVRVIPQQRYNGIALKTMPGGLVEQMLYVPEMPLGLITLWPVPSMASTMTISTTRVLHGTVTVDDTLVYPPGYSKFFVSNLSVEMAPAFQTEASTTTKSVAKKTMAAIKRANRVWTEARYDGLLAGQGPVTYHRGY